MSQRSRQAAAVQMERDGIRRIHRAKRPMCSHVVNPGDPITIRCHKRAGYSTPLGNCCFTHAVAQASVKPHESRAKRAKGGDA